MWFSLSFIFRPDTQAYIQKLEEEKIAKAKGNSTDNRSFFAKYVSILCVHVPGV